MNTTDRPVPTRRQFLSTTAGAAAGMASWLALGKAPAYAQKRELTFLSWNHFVPASDDELRKQAEAFSKVANCIVRVDTMAHLQMPAKVAAEAQSQSGHDMYRTASADPFLYENLLANMDDVVEKVGKQGGGWYNFAAGPSPVGKASRGSGYPSRGRTTWPTSRRPASSRRRRGPSC